ncbi:MAG: carboxypeptidase-like regulatory domain-containing protein [Bacteroidetes bacterium]|nr:carboxypeptidase-like regulatory domain-containing protein [Bacteroidota bacterium]
MLKKIHLVLLLISLIDIAAIAQEKKTKSSAGKGLSLIQFSGVVVEGVDLRPVPYTSIIVKNTHRGTISDFYGYFSFVAKVSDTIEFSAIGFSSAQYIIPDTLTSNTYSLIQVLLKDTVFLKLTEVFPWPSKEQFKQAFLNLDLPEDDMARASKNMDRSDIKDQMVGMAMDASLNYKYSSQQYQSKLYYAGQYPPNNLLNPIAWAKFIKAWKNGDFKKKD